jgi:NADPH2:quinone reductase
MRAIVFEEFGGPEKLQVQELPEPKPSADQVLIEVKAFGVNHAETHMRKGEWAESVKVSGIECVGLVKSDPRGRLARGQKVMALMGGMGRTIHGSYAEYTCAPASYVVPFESDLPWEELGAIPASYATAWSCLYGNLALAEGQSLVIREATSALGQAALNSAAHAGARTVATTRNPNRAAKMQELGAKQVMLEEPWLAGRVRELHPHGVDAVLELVGNSMLLDSLGIVRRGGRLCEAGWLGGLAPVASFNRSSKCLAACTSASSAVSCSAHRSLRCGDSRADDLRSGRLRRVQRETREGVPFRRNPGGPPTDGVESSKRQDRRHSLS